MGSVSGFRKKELRLWRSRVLLDGQATMQGAASPSVNWGQNPFPGVIA